MLLNCCYLQDHRRPVQGMDELILNLLARFAVVKVMKAAAI